MHSCCNLAKVSPVPIWHLPPSLASNHLAWSLERHLFASEVLVLQLGASLNEKSVTRGDVLTRRCRPSRNGPRFRGRTEKRCAADKLLLKSKRAVDFRGVAHLKLGAVWVT
jgi:hypothetical protein